MTLGQRVGSKSNVQDSQIAIMDRATGARGSRVRGEAKSEERDMY